MLRSSREALAFVPFGPCGRSVGMLFLLLCSVAQPSKVGSSPSAPQRFRGSKNLVEEQPKESRSLGDSGLGLSIFDLPTCHLSQSNCSLKEMTQPTLVYTDSDISRCWDGSPYAFVVRPGTAHKLLMYYTGGGACWEFPAFPLGNPEPYAENCRNSLEDLEHGVYGVGALDFADDRNFFKDYTFVGHPYCSGGLHAANTTVVSGGKTYYQYGYNNVEIARSWVVAQLADQPPLESLVIMGSSGGALGVAFWSDTLLSTIKYKKASVIMDSGVGILPENVLGGIAKTSGICGTPSMQRLPDNFRRDCEGGKLDLHELVDFTIGKFPDVAFAHIQPKGDLVQRGLYAKVALTFRKRPELWSKTKFNRAANEIFKMHSKHPNYVVYLVDGIWHTFAMFPNWYKATTASESGWWKPSGKLSLFEWAEKLVNHEKVDSQCHGWMVHRWFVFGARLCDKKLFPKTLKTSILV